MTDFQSGAGEELRLVVTAEQDIASGTDFTILPHSGNPTGPHKAYSRGPTDEVQDSLQIIDNPVRTFTAPFSFGAIYKHKAHDIPMEMVMGNSFSAAVSITGVDIAAVASGNKFTSVTVDKFNDLSADVPCPVWIFRDGASPLAIPAIALSVVEGASPELVIGTGAAGADFGTILSDLAASDTVTIEHDGILKNGVTNTYAMIERANANVGVFYVGFGMMCTGMDLAIQKGSDPTLGFNFMGRDADDDTATFGTGAEIAAPTFSAFNSGADLLFFGENGQFTNSDPTDAAVGWFPQAINASLASAANPIDPLGIDGPFANVKDTVILNGNFNLFTTLAARAVKQRQSTNVDSSLFWMNRKTVESVTNGYMWWIPRVQYVSGEPGGGGQQGTATINMPFVSARDQTHGLTLAIARQSAITI